LAWLGVLEGKVHRRRREETAKAGTAAAAAVPALALPCLGSWLQRKFFILYSLSWLVDPLFICGNMGVVSRKTRAKARALLGLAAVRARSSSRCSSQGTQTMGVPPLSPLTPSLLQLLGSPSAVEPFGGARWKTEDFVAVLSRKEGGRREFAVVSSFALPREKKFTLPLRAAQPDHRGGPSQP
jgi:hypothetical protein